MKMKRTPKKPTEPKRIVVAEKLTEVQYDDEEQTLLLTTPYNGKEYMLIGIKLMDEGVKIAEVKLEDVPADLAEAVWIDAMLWKANKLAELVGDNDD
jgi:hypothetical protein